MVNRVLIILLVLVVAVAYAQPPMKVFVATGKEVHAQAISPGTWTCVDGGYTGSNPPCGPGTTRVLVQGISNKLVYQDVKGSAAAMLGGENISTVNANLDANYYGHLWGTAQWTVPDMGGKWEGSFAAVADQMRGIVVNRAVLFGYGGKLEGLKMEYYAVSFGGETNFVAIVTPM